MSRRNTAKFPRQLLALILALVMTLGLAAPASAAAPKRNEPSGAAAADADGSGLLTPVPDPDEIVRVSIVLEKPSTLAAGYSTAGIASNSSAMAYRAGVRSQQYSVQRAIERDVLDGGRLDVVWNLTLAADIISANVRRGDIEAIRAMNGVAAVEEEALYAPVEDTDGKAAPNMAVAGEMSGAWEAWEAGYTGAGSKIAVIDSGIDVTHQSFDEEAFLHAISEQEGVQLMTAADVDKVVDQLNITQGRDGYTPGAGSLTGEQLYFSSKIPFGYNYVDRSLSITHMYDDQGEHGSHVAGIVAANRYVDTDGDGVFENAIDEVAVVGNAPDAQLLVMKVFGQGGGAYDSDYMAAVEDAIILGADAVNLSLSGYTTGSTSAGIYQDIMDLVSEKGTVIAAAAGNNGYWAQYSDTHLLYSDGVNFNTASTPATYDEALAVASVDNDGTISASVEVGGQRYSYSETLNRNKPIAGLEKDGQNEFEFVFLNSYGETLSEFNRADVEGKIAIVWRGGNANLTTKHENAQSAGALALIIANNAPGSLTMSLGSAELPAVAISQSAAQAIWAAAGGGELVMGAGGTASGKLILHSKPAGIGNHSDYYTMSDFSSWGVPGDLTLKPEITAPGGNIYSVAGATQNRPFTDGYEVLSGTSMAAPQVAGMAAQVQQYLREAEGAGITLPGDMTARELTQSLLMSTAVPMRDANGRYYPVIRQGAGLANVAAAVSTPAYITVKGQEGGKVKAELGDDYSRKGEYTVEFTIHNMTGDELKYDLSSDVFTQRSAAGYLGIDTTALDAVTVFYADNEKLESGTVPTDYDFNGDGKVDTDDAQVLLDSVVSEEETPFNADHMDVSGDGRADTYDVYYLLNMGDTIVEVPANGSVDVKAVITLGTVSRDSYPAGAYVEAFLTAEALPGAEGVKAPTLSVPVLGYYGSWSESSMFDVGTAAEWASGSFERAPYLRSALEGSMTNAPIVDGRWVADGDGVGPDSLVSGYRYTLIRSSGGGITRVTWKTPDGRTGTFRTEDRGPEAAAWFYYSYGMWFGGDLDSDTIYSTAPVGWKPVDENGDPLPAGTEIEISLIRAPEYYADENGKYDWDKLTDGDPANGELGKGAYLTTKLVVDGEPPVFTNIEQIQDPETKAWTIRASVKDDSGVRRVTMYSDAGEQLAYEFSPDYYSRRNDTQSVPTPTLTVTAPEAVFVAEFDGIYSVDSGYEGLGYHVWKTKADETLGNDLYIIEVEDVAGNVTTREVLAGVEKTDEVSSVTVTPSSSTMSKGSHLQLNADVRPAWLNDRSVIWTSGDPTVASVDANGRVTAVAPGTVDITATTKAFASDGRQLSDSCRIEVVEVGAELNAFVWDTMGYPWMARFDTARLPSYGLLTGAPYDVDLAAMTYGPDDVLYAASLDFTGTGDAAGVSSRLYTLDPVTYAPTPVGDASPVVYADLAPAEGLGDDVILGVSGPNVVLISTETGQVVKTLKYLGVEDEYAETHDGNLVGIAYERHDSSYGYDEYYYYLIDDKGYIYEESFTLEDGALTATYGAGWAVVEGSPIEYTTNVPYLNSAYCVDGVLYWNCFYQGATGEADRVTMVGIEFGADPMYGIPNIKEAHELGAFRADIRVGGLIQLKDNSEKTETATGITITQETAEVAVGGTVRLGAMVEPANLADSGVTWSVDPADESIAKVDQSGLVTGVAVGEATVTATTNADGPDGEKLTASCTVTVVPAAATDGLGAFFRDGSGNVTLSRFDPENPGAHTVVKDYGEMQFSAMTYGADGVLYATTIDDDGASSTLYSLDPDTFEPHQIGQPMDIAISDLTEGHNVGEHTIVGVSGPDIVLIDTENGTVKQALTYLLGNFSDDTELVAIAYQGSYEGTDYGYTGETTKYNYDGFWIIGNNGNLYFDTISPDSFNPGEYNTDIGSFYGNLGSIISSVSVTAPFNSAYAKEGGLYWSCYSEDTPFAALVSVSAAVSLDDEGRPEAHYTADGIPSFGTYGDGVSHVSGLVKLKGGSTTPGGGDEPTPPEPVTPTVTVNPKTASIEVGKTVQLTATVTPVDAGDVTWYTGDSDIVEVEYYTGEVTGLTAGEATVWAVLYDENGGTAAYDTCTVTVTEGSASGDPTLSVSPESISIEVGQTVTITATATPAGAGGIISWGDYDDTVIEIDGDITGEDELTATVIGLKAGSTEITVNLYSMSMAGTPHYIGSVICPVTVTEGTGGDEPTPPPAEGVKLNALIMDGNFETWMTEFDVTNPSGHTLLSTEPYPDETALTSLAYGPDGKLYGVNYDGWTVYSSDVFSVDSETYKATKISTEAISGGVVDLAETHSLGDNIVGVSGNTIMLIDTTSGEVTWSTDESLDGHNLVGIAYIDTQHDYANNPYDCFYLIDDFGVVYYGEIGVDQYFGGYSILGGLTEVGKTNETTTNYQNSAYYADGVLYWSHYNLETYASELLAVSIERTVDEWEWTTCTYKDTKKLGDFGEDDYTVTGLIRLESGSSTTPGGDEPAPSDGVKLNAVITDDVADTWMAEFDVTNPSGYTPLNAEPYPYDDVLTSLAYGPDGKLYGIESVTDYNRWDPITYTYAIDDYLCSFDPETYEITKIGTDPIEGGVADLAETHSFGNNIVAGVSGGNIMLIDTTSGEVKWSQQYLYPNYGSSSNLVGIAYVGSDSGYMGPYDGFYLIDDEGAVYYEGIVNEGGDYRISGSAFTSQLGETGYWTDTSGNSAYYTDGVLYWSHLIIDEEYYYPVGSELLAVNIEETLDEFGDVERTYNDTVNLGSFGYYVGPVTGLIQLKSAAETHSVRPTGGLASIDTGETGAGKVSGVTVDAEAHTVTVPVCVSDSTNGRFTLSYDSSVFTLTGTTLAGGTVLTGSVTEQGTIRAGYAAKDAVSGVVLTAQFTYNPDKADKTAAFTLTVLEEGADNSERGGVEYQVTLPGTGGSQTPGRPSGGGYTGGQGSVNSYSFADVQAGAWYEEYVRDVVEKGLMPGLSSRQFGVGQGMRRGEMAMVLYRMAGSPTETHFNCFKDVEESSAYCAAIAWADAHELMIGDGDGNFRPEDTISLQEMVLTLWRYAKQNGYDVRLGEFTMPAFSDLDKLAVWAEDAMVWAVKIKLVSGDTDGTLAPEKDIFNEEAAKIVSCFLALKK